MGHSIKGAIKVTRPSTHGKLLLMVCSFTPELKAINHKRLAEQTAFRMFELHCNLLALHISIHS